MILFFGSSCEDYLDKQPLIQPSSETFYSNEAEVFLAVNAAYNYLDPDETFGYNSFSRQIVHLGDAALSRWSGLGRPFRRGQANPASPEIEDYYSNHYKGISVCNLAIEGMEAAKSVMEAEGRLDVWERLRAEAQVIRAFLYLNLVNKFGDIPFSETQLGSPREYAEQGRTEEDVIYQFIFDEIEAAAEKLPLNNGPRIGQNAAYAVGARAALFRAFFKDGQAIQPETEYLNLVRDWTQKIIDSGGNALYYSGTDPDNSYKELFQYEGENSMEVVLQKEYNFNAGKGNSQPRLLGSRNAPNAFAAVTPMEYLIHTYEDTLGNTIDQSPYYNPQDPYRGRDPRMYQTVILPRVEGNQEISVTLNTSNGPLTLTGYNTVWEGSPFPDAFDPNLIRKFNSSLDAWEGQESIVTDVDNFHWYTDANGVDQVFQNQDALNPFSSFSGYLTYKNMDYADFPANGDNSSLNIMLIRYAEVLLMNAEARIELNDNLELAAEYINMVRARGYGMQPGEYMSHPSAVSSGDGQVGLRAIVRRERKVEFAHEGLRYDDLKRYGATMKALNQVMVGRPKFFRNQSAGVNIPIIDENAVVTMPWLQGLDPNAPDYPHRALRQPDYKAHYDLWPIPQSQFDNGTGLQPSDQNPGYLGS